MPTSVSVSGRSSSITNAFITAIVPTIVPTEDEEMEALRILGMSSDDIRCSYCGDRASEWDHLRPIVRNQEPTGYITEIANLVPSCGKCNQSKGKADWRTWMEGQARLSPKSRGVTDLDARVKRIEQYVRWRKPRKIDFAVLVGREMWDRHRENWKSVLGLLKTSQQLAAEIRGIVAQKESQWMRETDS